jgi:hypothetical protein
MNQPQIRYESRRGSKDVAPPKPEPRKILASSTLSGIGNIENQGSYHERPTTQFSPGIGSRSNKYFLKNLIWKITETRGWLKALKQGIWFLASGWEAKTYGSLGFLCLDIGHNRPLCSQD